MSTVDVGKEFYHRLANRNTRQGDGKHTAVEFRERYLSHLDNKEAWTKEGGEVTLDFSNVKKIGPSFANEAFGYFSQYVNPDQFLAKVQFVNATEVQMMIIAEELAAGYSTK